MNKIFVVVISFILCITLCSCATDQQISMVESNVAPSTQREAAPKEAAYPFEDNERRIHHQIYINGMLIETDHDAYTYPEEPKGAYYPIVEILKHLGVECLFDEHMEVLTTRLNGQVITCKTDSSDIVVGKSTLGGTAPEYIDGCFYVPSYTFMHLLNAVVDFTADRSGVTITTDTIIDSANSGTAGLSISIEAVSNLGEALYSGSEACGSCGSTGKSICTFCSGVGSVTQYTQAYDPITKQYKIQSTRAFCSRCGGSGRSTCGTCGGTGKH